MTITIRIDGNPYRLNPITGIHQIEAWGREVETFGRAMQSSARDFGEQEHAYIAALVLSAFESVPVEACNAFRTRAAWDDLQLLVEVLGNHFTGYLHVEALLHEAV